MAALAAADGGFPGDGVGAVPREGKHAVYEMFPGEPAQGILKGARNISETV